jgi:hypothetical protein
MTISYRDTRTLLYFLRPSDQEHAGCVKVSPVTCFDQRIVKTGRRDVFC